jgi:hypothetical protein
MEPKEEIDMRFFLVSCPVKRSQCDSIEDVNYDKVVSVYSKISTYIDNNRNEQPDIAQKLMSAFTKMGNVTNIPVHTPVRVWTDVYNSTREFASMVTAKSNGAWASPIQSVLLAPKSSGSKIFMGSANHKWETKFSFKKESLMQVSVRVELFFNSIRADHDNHAIENYVIFASPEILNLFQILWRRDSWEKSFSHNIEDYSVTLFKQDSTVEIL